MRLYNTLTRSLQEFRPIAPPAVTIYVCGPTVYDVPHIGHARSAYIFDLLRRYLASNGFQVTFVRNVTDVDDKIITKAREELGTGGGARGAGDSLTAKCKEVAERYLKSYHDALDRLGLGRPTVEPKATEHVVPAPTNVEATKQIDASMTGLIAQLLTRNAAYSSGGDVYFSVRRFAEYGKLSNRTIDELKSGARVEPGERKEDPLDFALWKAAKPDEPSWNSPWGPGRPGWHVECSLMSTAYLGDAFDIHGGGVDLVFPHHENEIAQARAAGKPFARHWVHNGLLTVNGEKMSKSLGNYITIDNALEACHGEPDVLKIFFLGAHYRSPIDYSQAQVTAAYHRWYGLNLLLEYASNERHKWKTRWSSLFPHPALIQREGPGMLQPLKEQFQQALGDDLNTSVALSCLDRIVERANIWRKSQDLLRQVPEGEPAPHLGASTERPGLSLNIIEAADLLRELGGVLGLFASHQDWQPSPAEQALRDQREEARKRKDFATADRIRKELDARGLVVEDTAEGPVVRRKT